METEITRDSQERTEASFVGHVIAKIKVDLGYRAVMSHADNPNQESLAWEHLIAYCDIGKEDERKAYALVGAAIARNRPQHDGNLSIGSAFRYLVPNSDKKAEDREMTRLRRLLSCDSREELIQVVRPVLSYLSSRGTPICYRKLLQDIRYWGENTKIRWAQDFFYRAEDSKE